MTETKSEQFRQSDTRREIYGLHWCGKQEAYQSAFTPSAKTLIPHPEDSIGWETTQNLFVTGDNLDVMKLLRTDYAGKIKMVYIDPPYNTSKIFSYSDRFQESMRDYRKRTAQTESVEMPMPDSDTSERKHTNWLNMMYPRLLLACDILSEDGIIFISIDDSEQARLKLMCDEIFGENNFVAQIIVQSNKRGQTFKPISKTHEYLLCYRKSEKGSINELKKPAGELKYEDEHGGYDLWELRNRNPKFGRHTRPSLYYPIFVDTLSADSSGLAKIALEKNATYSVEVLPKNSKGADGCWRWSRTKLLEDGILSEPQAVFAKEKRSGGWNIYQKSRKTTTKPKSIWDDAQFINEKGTIEAKRLGMGGYFDFPKPLELIKRCVYLGSSDGDIVLDFFGGSGTTAHAVMSQNSEDNLNRWFICIQSSEPIKQSTSIGRNPSYATIAELARERIRRAGSEIKIENESVDVGFKAYSISE